MATEQLVKTVSTMREIATRHLGFTLAEAEEFADLLLNGETLSPKQAENLKTYWVSWQFARYQLLKDPEIYGGTA